MWVIPVLNQDQTPRRSLLAPLGAAYLAAMAMLTGCGQTSQVWVWAPSPGVEGSPADVDPQTRPDSDRRTPDRTDPGVAVFARPGFHAEYRPETARRDALISARAPDALPDRLAWPEAARPDLRSTRSLTTSRTPERWVYPTTRRDHTHRRHTDFRAW